MKTTSDVPDYHTVKTKTATKKRFRKRTDDNSIIGPGKPREVSVLDEYRSMDGWRVTPVTDSVIERLAMEMVEWAANDKNALRIADFFLMKKIPRRYLYRWKDKSEVMTEAFEFCTDLIASRREIGAIKREYDPGMIKFMQPHYDKDWKDMEAWRATLTDKNEKQGDIKVIIERFPSVADVKEKE